MRGIFHFFNFTPNLGVCIIALSGRDAAEIAIAPENKYLIIKYFNTKVGACSVNTGQKIP